MLVLTDGWDAGWSARLDGGSARVLRVNHGEMAVALPAGPHRVAFEYRPPGLAAGLGLAVVGAAVLAELARRRLTLRRRAC